jgi:LmbE family N-acetylglucosaminyl deacetylase
MNNKSIHLLSVAPHPLDNDWGIGGTVARLAREGKEVVYVICTNGDKGSSDPKMKAADLARIREQEQTAAAKILGVKEVIFLRHPDLGLENVTDFRQEMLRLILEYRPEIVATVKPYEHLISNPDHRIAGRAVLDAVWPFAHAPNVFRDLMDQGLELHRVKEVILWGGEEHNHYRDISDTFELKLAALHCHKSQVDDIPADWAGHLKKQAEELGKIANCALAEVFFRVDVPPRL